MFGSHKRELKRNRERSERQRQQGLEVYSQIRDSVMQRSSVLAGTPSIQALNSFWIASNTGALSDDWLIDPYFWTMNLPPDQREAFDAAHKLFQDRYYSIRRGGREAGLLLDPYTVAQTSVAMMAAAFTEWFDWADTEDGSGSADQVMAQGLAQSVMGVDDPIWHGGPDFMEVTLWLAVAWTYSEQRASLG